MVDVSAVARVLGIETSYKDLRGGNVLFLPQRIAVFAQGSSDVTYSTTKWQAPSAGAGAARFGFGCPIHSILRELQPVNGDGVGTIPVTVYPLADAAGSVAAAGLIVPSGTATLAASYRARFGGVQSEPFVIPAGAISVTNTLGAMGDAINAVLEMPVKISYTYGTVTSAAGTNTGNGTVTALSVTGTPRPGAWTLRCITAVANGGVFRLFDPLGAQVGANITLTVGAGAATVVNQGGIQFTVTDAGTDFAVNDSFTITVPATNMIPTAKWKGASGNNIKTEILGDSVGVTFTITQLTGGLVNPSLTAALAQVGGVWESMAINALNIDDTTSLDAFQTFGEGRWGELTRQPLVVFTGNTASTVANATTVSSVRRTDRVNAQLVAPGSPNMPHVVAARELARIARVANNNPPTDYGSQRATGIIPGTDGEQWDYPMRDQAVKLGSSTVEVKDGVVNLSDTITFYRPTGEEPPAYRFVCDIVKLQQVIFNLALLFATPEWDGAPLIPDNQPTVNPLAKKPKNAKALVAKMLDSLGDNAIISDPATAKKTIIASINSQNPKRLDIELTVQLSGNANVKGIKLLFGFFFGTPVAVN